MVPGGFDSLLSPPFDSAASRPRSWQAMAESNALSERSESKGLPSESHPWQAMKGQSNALTLRRCSGSPRAKSRGERAERVEGPFHSDSDDDIVVGCGSSTFFAAPMTLSTSEQPAMLRSVWLVTMPDLLQLTRPSTGPSGLSTPSPTKPGWNASRVSSSSRNGRASRRKL